MVIDDTWEIVKLGDEKYFKIIGSGIKKFLNSKDYLSTSSIDYNVIKQVEETITFKNRPSRANMQPVLNSVWFARMKDTIKVYSFTKNNQEEINKYILSTGFAGIKCLKEIDPDYLKFYFLSDNFNKQKNKLCSGSTQKAINNSSIKKISVPLPPLPVQKRIVSILEKAERLKERRKKANEETNKITQSVFYEMFVNSQKKGVWPERKIADISFIISGGTPSRKKPEYFKGKIPWVTSVSLTKPYITSEDGKEYITEDAIRNSATHLVTRKSVLFGNRVCVGNVAINLVPITFSQDVVSIQYDENLIVAEYLMFFLKSKKKYFESRTRGSTIKGVTIQTIKELKIPLPPLNLQLKFASVVKKIESMKERQKKSTEDINQLFDALMSKAFKGEL